jgi:predicted NUDIX family phosphoesterase
MSIVIHPKKHPQSILGFFSEFFRENVRCVGRPHGFSDGITEWDFNEFLQASQAYHVIGQRALLEDYLGVRQALPCAAISSIRESDGAEVFWMFQRTDKIGEDKLVGMTACFWGGHVDGKDAVFDEKSRLDLEATLTVGRDREQGEEYRIYEVSNPGWSIKLPLTPANLFIANSTVEVDKYHVAIIYKIALPKGYAVEVLEEELIGIPVPMSAQEALDAHEAGEIKLESWAQIYFRHVRAQELLNSGAVVATEPMVDKQTETVTVKRADGSVLTTFETGGGISITRENIDAIPLDTGLEVSGVLDWDSGPWYEAYVARGGKHWDEFKRKIIYMFGTNSKVWETPKDANATEEFPQQAERHPFFFRSASGEHTFGQVLSLIDAMIMNDFKDRVLVHVDFTEDMKQIGEPYRLIKGDRVPITVTQERYDHAHITQGRGGERLDNQRVLVIDDFGSNEHEFVEPFIVSPRDVKANGEVVTTGASRFDVPLTLGDINLHPDSTEHGYHAKASIKRVYFRLIGDDGCTEVIAADIVRAVNSHDVITEEEEKTVYPVLRFSHPVVFAADTVQYFGQESAILKSVLGSEFTSVAFNFEITGRVLKETNQLILSKEGPHMVGFNHRNGRSYLDGEPLPHPILEAATDIIYLKVDLIGADLVFDPV